MSVWGVAHISAFYRLMVISFCFSLFLLFETSVYVNIHWWLEYLHVYAKNFHLLFLEQSESLRQTEGIAATRAQLGFWWLEAGLDYLQLKWKKNVLVFFKALLLLCWAHWICGTLQSACFPLPVVCFHWGSLSMGILAQWGLPHPTQHTDPASLAVIVIF